MSKKPSSQAVEMSTHFISEDSRLEKKMAYFIYMSQSIIKGNKGRESRQKLEAKTIEECILVCSATLYIHTHIYGYN